MNTKINFSGLKDKINTVVVVVIAMIFLVAVLGVASYFTIEEVAQLQERINASITTYEENKALVASLEDLKADSAYFEAQQAEYDKVIAENGSYNVVDYYVEVDELCRQFDLQIVDIQLNDMQAVGLTSQATTTLAVVGEEANVKRLATHIVSQEEIARIDTIAMAEQSDGTVAATMVIVNFTK